MEGRERERKRERIVILSPFQASLRQAVAFLYVMTFLYLSLTSPSNTGWVCINHHVGKTFNPSKCQAKSRMWPSWSSHSAVTELARPPQESGCKPSAKSSRRFYFWPPVCSDSEEENRARRAPKKLLRASVISMKGTRKAIVYVRWRRKFETKGKYGEII